MSTITFNFEKCPTITMRRRMLKSWIIFIAKQHGYKVGCINFIFCPDDSLHEMNLKYLNHDTLTDVITFDYTEGKEISGDIFISVDRIGENADLFHVKRCDEMHRVMIHGVLHLLGFSDKSDSERELMRAQEDRALADLITIN